MIQKGIFGNDKKVREPISGGARANRTGDELERDVCLLLLGRSIKHKRHVNYGPGIKSGNWYIDIFIDYLQRYPRGVGVECKSQDSPGSAEEKLIFTADQIVRCARHPFVIVLGGKLGFDHGIVSRVEAMVDGKSLIGVMEWGEFREWLRRANQ